MTTYEVILEYINHTSTKAGLKIRASLDTKEYETGRKITDEQMKKINCTGDAFHPEWNYIIKPQESL